MFWARSWGEQKREINLNPHTDKAVFLNIKNEKENYTKHAMLSF